MTIERNLASRSQRVTILPRLAACAMSFAALTAISAPASPTLDRIRESGHIRLGYLRDARPFTFGTEANSTDGYSIALCSRVAAAVKQQLALANLTIDWIPMQFEERLSQTQQGNVDVLCAPTAVTLARRRQVSFSIPVFPGGTRAVLRADAPAALRDALSAQSAEHVVWRGSPAAKTLSGTSVAVVAGTTTQNWLLDRLYSLQIGATMVRVSNYRTGLQLLSDRKVDVFFGDRALVLGATDSELQKEVVVLDRLFTHEPLALALDRNDEEFRLLVDRALSQLYASAAFRELYTKWFGEFNENTAAFFLWNTVES